MERLISFLEGDAKKAICSIGTQSIFYATALKTRKRDFGNPVVVAHLKIKSLFDAPQIYANDRVGLRQFHLQHDIRVGNCDAPVAVKTTLGWVLIGGKRSNSVNTNIVSTNKLNINYDDELKNM